MTLHAFIRGNPIYMKKLQKKWRLKSTGEKLTDKLIDTLPCVRCGKSPIKGHDACCANTPGVKNMCCGHGVDYPYIQFENELPGREVK